MKRTLGIPAAIAVLVVLPGIVSPAPAQKEELAAEKPAAAEASLTVDLEGDQGGGDPYLFKVTADGPPPKEPVTLSDATGRATATVSPAEGCTGEPRFAFPGKAEPWCLRLISVDEGHELTGVVKAAETATVGSRALKVTVNRRDRFFGLPLAVLVAGLLLGAIVVSFKAVLQRPVRRVVLGGLLRANRRAPTAERIVGLTEFAGARLAAGESLDEVTAMVAALRENGPAAAQTARKELAASLEKLEPEPPSVALVAVARKEAERTDNRVEDFYDKDGKRKPQPAQELLTALGQLQEDLQTAAKLHKAIGALREENRKAPREALARAEEVAKSAADPGEVARVLTLLEETRDAIEKARAGEAATIRRGAAQLATVAPIVPQPPPPLSAPELGGGKLGRLRATAALATVAAIAAIVVFAAITVKQAAYDPKLTFSSFSDYFTLGSAALGSSAAGSVLLLLGLWFPMIEQEG